MEKYLLRQRQETNSLDTFFIIEIKVEAPSGASTLYGGPYLELETASRILMDYPQLILIPAGYRSEHACIGFIRECYIDTELKTLDTRATEVYK